jgi:hypothetical protein
VDSKLIHENSRIRELRNGLKFSPTAKWPAAVITTLLFSLSLCLNYLHANAYTFYRPEALAFIFLSAGAVVLLFTLFNLVYAEWVFYSLLIVLFLDLSLGAAHFIYLVSRKVLPFKSLFLAYFGLITFFFLMGFLLREKMRAVALVFFGTIFLTTIPFLPFRDNQIYTTQVAPERSGPVLNRPNILFLILDEHIGINGIPSNISGGIQLKKDLLQMYQRDGFLVFTKAFSNYNRTDASLGSIFNQTIYKKRSEVKGLKENLLLQKLKQEGYAINGYQSDYLYFCGPGYQKCDRTFTYMQNSVGYLLNVRTTALQRFLPLFDGLIFSYKSVVAKSLRNKLSARPAYSASIATDRILDEMTRDYKEHPKGNVFLVHLLMPHFPFIFDTSCNFKPEYDRHLNRDIPLSEQKYRFYFEQTRCLHRKLATLLDELSKDREITIFVLGDHGARIRKPPSKPDEAKTEDYIDHFSTFLAIHPGRYNPEFENDMENKTETPISVARVVQEYFNLDPRSFTDKDFEKVYFRFADQFAGKPMVPFPAHD